MSRAANRQRGALLLATLIALATLSLLGAAALEAVLLEQRMVGNVALRQALLAAADEALDEVERQLQNAVLTEDEVWLDAAGTEQSLALPGWNAEVRYGITLCCDSAWDSSLPLAADNVARLYRLGVEVTSTTSGASSAVQSTYLVAPATASLPPRARRVAWRRAAAAL